MRSIIVEGPDGAGKSTLAKELAEILGYRYQTTGGALDTPEALANKVEECMESGVVYDRHPLISDMVYKAALGKDLLCYPSIMIDALYNWAPIVIYCRLNDIQAMADNMVRSNKAHKPPEFMEMVLANQKRIVGVYEILFGIYPCVRFDWTTQSLEELMSLLLDDFASEGLF
jgi:adenylate kinase family enzyme